MLLERSEENDVGIAVPRRRSDLGLTAVPLCELNHGPALRMTAIVIPVIAVALGTFGIGRM